MAAGPGGRAGQAATEQASGTGGSWSLDYADLGAGQQAPGRRPHHCPGRTTANSANMNSKTNNMSTPSHSL